MISYLLRKGIYSFLEKQILGHFAPLIYNYKKKSAALHMTKQHFHIYSTDYNAPIS